MFENIDIGIKTFLRDPQLFTAIDGIRRNFSNARMVIVDDGDQTEEKDSIYGDLHRAGHITDVLPFDSGFGKKSNRMVELSTRPYLLIASDDFVFDEQAAKGLSNLQRILDYDKTVDIASGRVNGNAYEFYLRLSKFPDGVHINEIPVVSGNSYGTYAGFPIQADGDSRDESDLFWFYGADLTVNYSLIRREVFNSVRWDDDVKIGGGEHGAFFYDCKVAGFRTAFSIDANINEQQVRNSSRYMSYRRRADSPERPCFDRRDIISWTLGNGVVDYRRS